MHKQKRTWVGGGIFALAWWPRPETSIPPTTPPTASMTTAAIRFIVVRFTELPPAPPSKVHLNPA
jgi:hypothetical protein